jgi:hypothetical protein
LICTECANEAHKDEHGCCDVCGEDKVHEIFLGKTEPTEET